MPESRFATIPLSHARAAVAPDGSCVRPLLHLPGGSMARFELEAGKTTRPVAHRTVAEIWYVVSGQGEMWRKQGQHEETVALAPDICLSIPAGTHFQFRAATSASLAVIAVTMPPWPGEAEAVAVNGPWTSSLSHESRPAGDGA